jgi:hypothetical protein
MTKKGKYRYSKKHRRKRKLILRDNPNLNSLERILIRKGVRCKGGSTEGYRQVYSYSERINYQDRRKKRYKK